MIQVNTEIKAKRGSANLLLMAPLLAIVIVVPLIVYMRHVALTGMLATVWPTKDNNDFFSYYKAVALGILTGTTCVSALYLQIRSGWKYLRFDSIFIPLALFLFLVVASTVFSEYSEVATIGSANRYEGMWVWLCYGLVCFFTFGMVRDDGGMKAFMVALAVGFVAVGIVGAFQFAGLDPLRTTFIERLTLPAPYKDHLGGFNFKEGDSFVYSTLFHSNYMGSYVALMAPVAAVFLVMSSGWKKKLAAAPFVFLAVILFIGCRARSGMIGVGISVVVFAVFFATRNRKKTWPKALRLGILAFMLVAATGFCFLSVSKNRTAASIRYSLRSSAAGRAVTLVQDIFSIFRPGTQRVFGADTAPFENPEVTADSIRVKVRSETLVLHIEGLELSPTDGAGKPLAFQYYGSKGYSILNERYQNFAYGWLDDEKVTRRRILVQQKFYGLNFFFAVENGRPVITDFLGREITFGTVKHWGFEGYERIGSSRGYIWSRTIPLIAERPFFGHGPDTLALYFPQHDLKGQFHAYSGQMWNTIDKPHNLYLQVAFNSGIPALLAMLAFFGIYLARSAKLYFRTTPGSVVEIAGFGIFLGIAGYLAAGFFNDSIVSVAPVFWAMLGAGIGMNRIVGERRRKS